MIYFYNKGEEDNMHNPLNNIVIYSLIGVIRILFINFTKTNLSSKC